MTPAVSSCASEPLTLPNPRAVGPHPVHGPLVTPVHIPCRAVRAVPAADHVKFFVPFTAAFATLGLGAVIHEDGYRAAGEWDNMARNLQYGADYLMK